MTRRTFFSMLTAAIVGRSATTETVGYWQPVYRNLDPGLTVTITHAVGADFTAARYCQEHLLCECQKAQNAVVKWVAHEAARLRTPDV